MEDELQAKYSAMLDATVDRVMGDWKDDMLNPMYRIIVKGLVASLFNQMLEASTRLGLERTVELWRATADAFELATNEARKDLKL